MRNAKWKLGAAILSLIGIVLLVGVLISDLCSVSDPHVFSCIENENMDVTARFVDGIPASFMNFAVLFGKSEDAEDWKPGIIVDPDPYYADEFVSRAVPFYHIESRKSDESWTFKTSNIIRCNIDGVMRLTLQGVDEFVTVWPSDPILSRVMYWPMERRILGLRAGYRYGDVIDGTIYNHLLSLSAGYSMQRNFGCIEWELPADVPHVQIVGLNAMPDSARIGVSIEIRSRDGLSQVEGAPKFTVIARGPLDRERPVIRIPLQPIGGGWTRDPVLEGEPVHIGIGTNLRRGTRVKGLPFRTTAYLKPGLVLEIDMRDIVQSEPER